MSGLAAPGFATRIGKPGPTKAAQEQARAKVQLMQQKRAQLEAELAAAEEALGELPSSSGGAANDDHDDGSADHHDDGGTDHHDGGTDHDHDHGSQKVAR